MLSGRGSAVVQSGGATPAVVTVSGQDILAFAFGSDATAELFFNDDGTVDERINLGGLTQIDSGTDWVIPNSAAPGLWQGRYTGLTGDTLSSATAAEDVWRAFSIPAFFTMRNVDTTPLLPTQDSTFTFQIREGTGSVIDSASYRLLADREDF